MTQTTARLTKGGKKFEILVDLDEALKIKKDAPGANLNVAVVTTTVFHNLKSGDVASREELVKNFTTDNFEDIARRIIKAGELEMPESYLKEGQNMKYKQVVDFISKNAVSPEGRPYTPDRIMKALKEANVNVKNKPIDTQITEITDQLRKVLPLKLEMKKLAITIPAQHTGRAYGVINEFKESEEWLANGDLRVIINLPAGLEMDFYDKLNGVTHGSALSEEVK